MLSTLCVDADAPTGGDGLSWPTAYHDLQAALDSAAALNADADPGNDVDAIWIAEGTYRPTAELESGDPRSASFSLVDGVTLYGGFTGTEAALEARDWTAHETILSGDIGVVDDASDNAYTVVYCGENVEAGVDGVSVVGGNADGDNSTGHLEQYRGGAVYGFGILSVTNCRISDNFAFDGGGICNHNTLTVANCQIVENAASWGAGVFSAGYGTLSVSDSWVADNVSRSVGGGIYSVQEGLTSISNSTFQRNSAGGGSRTGGGAIFSKGEATVTDCTFVENSSSYGGAINTDQSGTLTVTGSSFSENAGRAGGAIFGDTRSDVTVTDSTFSENSAESGGAVYASSLTMTNSTIVDNTAADSGGGIVSFGTTTIRGCAISRNTAMGTQVNNGSGGAIYNYSGGLALMNSTLAENSANLGGAIWNTGELTVVNSTLAGNAAIRSGGGISNSGYGEVTVTNSTIAANSAGSGGGIHCSDMRNCATLNNAIVAGNWDVTGVGPDIYHESGTLTGTNSLIGDGTGQADLVDGENGNLVGTALSPANPLLSGWVQFENGLGGYYPLPGSPALDAGDDSLAVDASGDPLSEDLFGNFRIVGASVDIGAVEGASTGTPAQTYLVTSLEKTVAEDGVLTFLEAFEAANWNQPVGDAPAGSFSESDTIRFAEGLSGTLLLDGTELTIFGDLNIEGPGNGLLTFDGSGESRVFSVRSYASVTLSGMTVTGGLSEYGGAIYNHGGTLTIADSVITENSATETYNGGGYGGAIYNHSGMLSITNSTLSGNRATGDESEGGAVYSAGLLSLANCTVSANWAECRGGGIHSAGSGSSVVLNNTIVAGNWAVSGLGSDIYRESGTVSGSHNLIGDGSSQYGLVDGEAGNQVGTESSPIDPLLSESAPFENGFGLYLLLPGSPALDAGDDALALDTDGNPLSEDLCGNPRILGDSVDIGAVEGATAGTPAQTYLVTSLEETVAEDGVLTFLEAFEAANRNRPVGDAPAGSYSEADTIRFAEGVEGTIFVDEGELMVLGNLYLEGPGAGLLTFDGGGQNRIFFIRPNRSVTLSGITVTNGSATYGGGIHNYGALSLADSTISESSASCFGGGIYNTGTLTVANSTIAENTATDSGGGIYSTASATLAVENSTLSGNVAMKNEVNSGGGIFNAGTAIVRGTTVEGNSSYFAGGGIYNSGFGTLTIEDSTLASNSTWRGQSSSLSCGGGGIYSCGILTVSGSALVENSAAVDPIGKTARGGGINGSGTMTITNSLLEGNTSAHFGGGISMLSGTLTIENCTLTENTASTSGGGISSSGSGTVAVANSTFSRNSAAGTGENRGGGAVFNAGSVMLTIANSVFEGNSVEAEGGGIYNSGALAITNSRFTGNLAGDRGGAVFDRGEFTLNNSTIAGNSADALGGGIYSSGTLTLNNSILWRNVGETIWGEVSGSRNVIGFDPGFVRDPSPGTDGVWGTDDDDYGDLHLTAHSPAVDFGDDSLLPADEFDLDGDGDTAEAVPLDLDGNPRIYGTAVDCGVFEFQDEIAPGREAGSVTVTTSDDAFDFYDNQTSLREAVWYADPQTLGTTIAFDPALDAATITLLGQSLSIDRSVIIDASALESLTIDAAGNSRVLTIISSTADVELDGLTITGGSASSGGGIYNSGTLTLTDSVLRGNQATEKGGAIYSRDAGIVTIRNSRIEDNTAASTEGSAWGGGIYTPSSGVLTITDSTFSNNSATGIFGSGGGICSAGVLSVDNSVFEGNWVARDGGSAQGGAIRSTGTLNVTNSSFTDNSTTDAGTYGSGGGICSVGSGTLGVANSTFERNSAGYGGGIHYESSGPATVTNCTFVENSATSTGAGLCNAGAMVMTGCTFSENAGGGAISNYDDLQATDCLLVHNSGGGIQTGGTLTLTNSSILGNTTSGCGAGLHNNGTTIVANVVFAGNSAEQTGGGIYNHDTLTLVNSTLSRNSTDSYGGGGIYVADNASATVMNNTIVAGNWAEGPARDVYCIAGPLSGSHNLAGIDNGSQPLVHGENGNLVGTFETPIDPLFVRNADWGTDRIWGTEDDDYGDLRLQTASPAMNAGDNALLPEDTADLDADGDVNEPLPYDLDGSPRISGETVDMGAYEVFVATGVPGDLNGDSLVGGADLDIIRANWGRTVTAGSLFDGDPSGDGVVGGTDLDIVRANWGSTAPVAAGADAVFGENGGEDALVYGPRRRESLAPSASGETTTAQTRANEDLLAAAMEAWEREWRGRFARSLGGGN